ncbi:hypothetical protein PMAYCL1PPCAC_12808, partial [Pristionchus mayeri]
FVCLEEALGHFVHLECLQNDLSALPSIFQVGFHYLFDIYLEVSGHCTDDGHGQFSVSQTVQYFGKLVACLLDFHVDLLDGEEEEDTEDDYDETSDALQSDRDQQDGLHHLRRRTHGIRDVGSICRPSK